jgi:hypothetical protein
MKLSELSLERMDELERHARLSSHAFVDIPHGEALALIRLARLAAVRGEALVNAAIALERCPKSESGAGGQTTEACLGRTFFHRVPYSLYGEIRAALATDAAEGREG